MWFASYKRQYLRHIDFCYRVTLAMGFPILFAAPVLTQQESAWICFRMVHFIPHATILNTRTSLATHQQVAYASHVAFIIHRQPDVDVKHPVAFRIIWTNW